MVYFVLIISLISELGSSRSPKIIAPLDSSTHAGLKTYSQSLITESTFFHNTLGPCWKFRIFLSDKRPGVSPVKAPCTVGTGSHAVPAADTAVHIHHDYPVFTFECSLCRTHPYTGRFSTVIAKNHKGFFFHLM